MYSGTMDFTLRTIPTTSPSIIISVSKLSCSLMTLLEKVFTLARRIFGWCVGRVLSELAKCHPKSVKLVSINYLDFGLRPAAR